MSRRPLINVNSKEYLEAIANELKKVVVPYKENDVQCFKVQGEEIDFVWCAYEVQVKEEVPETKIPEGVETVKYTFVNDKDAELVETMFDAITTGKYEFRSAVNIGTMVRCVMYEKGEKVGTPMRVIVTDKDMAWHLQQLIDWCLRNQAKILATRREGKVVEVAFRMEGIKPLPKEEKEKLWYHFKKTDGWSLVGEEK